MQCGEVTWLRDICVREERKGRQNMREFLDRDMSRKFMTVEKSWPFARRVEHDTRDHFLM